MTPKPMHVAHYTRARDSAYGFRRARSGIAKANVTMTNDQVTKRERMIVSAHQIVCDLLASRLLFEPASRTQ